jgi:hypothetical protein
MKDSLPEFSLLKKYILNCGLLSNMEWYLSFVKQNPILSAVIQFAILGTLGELFSKWMVKRQVHFPFTVKLTIWKAVVWGILAVCIKYAFIGFNGFTDSLVEHGFLPPLNIYTRAFVISAAMNLQFGPFLVLFHRYLDNIYPKTNNWNNINKGLMSLLWFWIPAHTITFMLPKDFQIGLAALWSVALGIILGYFARPLLPGKLEARVKEI